MTPIYDTLIIGAGMSGLAAGIRLAYYGQKVLILEQHSVPGGLNSYYVRNRRVLDVGLHAMTNYAERGIRSAPLNRLLRQLKIKRDEFSLVQQGSSLVRFPHHGMAFTNDITDLTEEISKTFPNQLDSFQKLVTFVRGFDALSLDSSGYRSARETVSEYISDPILLEMIFCPLMYYGSSWEDDMNFPQFVIMFQAIFLEGFARPDSGVLKIIQTLKKKYLENGGELRFKAMVQNILVRNGSTEGVRLDSGEEILAKRIFSSAGLCETSQLLDDQLLQPPPPAGELSFTEVILFLKQPLREKGYDHSIQFYNDGDHFEYRKARHPVDLRSGVICVPDNFRYGEGEKPDPVLRLTHIARHDSWTGCNPAEYSEQKNIFFEKIIENAKKYVPLDPENIIFSDMFTPATITRFTGHLNGAVYGSPMKTRDGKTKIKNLFICGTDQGFLGIVGAMLSGISMANLHGLQ